MNYNYKIKSPVDASGVNYLFKAYSKFNLKLTNFNDKDTNRDMKNKFFQSLSSSCKE